ncbi:MAG TPA: ATP-binding protein [Candidatus Cloacimonadota bacterium]|nr:ATP-binding protein [Candidatus Cloacimonadota bacterium]
MKEIVIISGKGGTGKTSVAAALAYVAGKVVLADCDVDAADLHLILKPQIRQSEDFYSGVKAVIDPNLCSGCGMCQQICRFMAIEKYSGKFKVAALDCEGCGYCYHVCPTKAISLVEQKVGQCFISDTRYAGQLVHARLGIGADNSGKLVAKVKKDARELATSTGYVLVDGSPGIGCPVISSLTGADYVLLVTEPSLSGLSDLKRVWELIQRFHIPAAAIINKADLNFSITTHITEFLAQEGILHLDSIPYDEDFSLAITQGLSLTEFNPEKWKDRFTTIWSTITKEIQ